MARPDRHPPPEPSPPNEAAATAPAARGPLIHVATRCTSIDEFVEKFAAFASEGALVLPASAELAVDTEGRFAILLLDRSVAMRGRCRVTESKPGPVSPNGPSVRRIMLRVALIEMDGASEAVHRRLLAAQRPPVPLPIAQSASERTQVSPSQGAVRPPVAARPIVPPPVTVRPVIAPPLAVRPFVSAPVGLRPVASRPVVAPPVATGPVAAVPAPVGPVVGPAVAIRAAPARSAPSAVARATGLASPADARARAHTLIGVAASPRPAETARVTQAAADISVTAVAPARPAETRIPGAAYTLPANPLSEIGAEDLASFIDCTLYETDAEDNGEIEVLVDDDGPSTQTPLPKVAPYPLAPGSRPPEISNVVSPPQKRARAAAVGPTGRVAAPPWWRSTRVGLFALCVLIAGTMAGVLAHRHRSAVRAPLLSSRPSTPPETPVAAAGPDTGMVVAASPGHGASRAPLTPPDHRDGTAPSGCIANVATQPDDAKIYWGETLIGRSPIEGAAVPCGVATVTLRRDRYQPVTREITASSGTATVVSEPLHRPAATLIIGSSPPHAELSVNGQDQGATPRHVAVSRFESVSLRVSLPGYAPWKKKVYVREAETRIGMQLVPSRGDARRAADR